MIDPHWVFAAALLGVVGSIRYAVAIVRGAVRPNLVTWSLWAAAPLIGFFAQLDSEVGLPAVMTLAAGAGPLIVIATSLIARRHYARLSMVDLVCAGVAGVALAVWLGLNAASLAVLFAVAADAIAAIPTLIKGWRHPDSENAFFYVIVGIAATITLLTITAWTPQASAFAVYQLSLCATLVVIIMTRRRAHQRALSTSA